MCHCCLQNISLTVGICAPNSALPKAAVCDVPNSFACHALLSAHLRIYAQLAYFLIDFLFFFFLIYFPFKAGHEIHYFQAFILNASSPSKAWPTLTFPCIA